jgi:hypothetical protein
MANRSNIFNSKKCNSTTLAKENGGAYTLKVEPQTMPRGSEDIYVGDILTVLSSGLTELTSKLEMLGSEARETREVCYVM